MLQHIQHCYTLFFGYTPNLRLSCLLSSHISESTRISRSPTLGYLLRTCSYNYKNLQSTVNMDAGHISLFIGISRVRPKPKHEEVHDIGGMFFGWWDAVFHLGQASFGSRRLRTDLVVLWLVLVRSGSWPAQDKLVGVHEAGFDDPGWMLSTSKYLGIVIDGFFFFFFFFSTLLQHSSSPFPFFLLPYHHAILIPAQPQRKTSPPTARAVFSIFFNHFQKSKQTQWPSLTRPEQVKRRNK